MKPSIGWIGVGLMGRPMVACLLKAGYTVTVWNRTKSRTTELVEKGAKLAATPRDTAAGSDVVFMIVSDQPAVEQVLWGEAGALEGLRKGSVLVDSSTVSPALARRIAQAVKPRGVEFLDAPVTGGTWGAEKGELVFMIGGEAETLKRVEPIIAVMGKKWFHLGPHGAGQTVKVAMNLLNALEVEAFAESLALTTRAGIPGEKVLEVMQSSMSRSGVLDVKGPRMLKGDYTPSFSLRLMHKDISIAIELANQLGVPMPAGAAAREAYSAVKGADGDDVDFCSVYRFWKRN